MTALYLSTSAVAQSLPAGVEKRVIADGNAQQSYYLYVPEDAKQRGPLPAIVLMHGAGGTGLDQITAWKPLAQANRIVLIAPNIVAPNMVAPNIGNAAAAWDELYDHPEWIGNAIDDAGKKHSLDRRRIYLWGYSAGGMFAFYLAFLESRYFAAAAVHGGVIENFKYQMADFASRKVPFAYYMGTQDQWWRVEQARATRDAMTSRGFTVHYLELKGADHNFFARQEEITTDAWKFMKQYALATDPQFDALDLPKIKAALYTEKEIQNSLNTSAMEAYRTKNYARFLAYEMRALQLEPTNARLLYNVACGEALSGNAGEAVRYLDELLARKIDFGAGTDEDFSSIRKTTEWAGFESRLIELRKPVVHSEVAFRLDDPALVATGVAVDPRTGDTFVASVRQRKILRRTKEGAVSDFIKPAQDGFLAGNSLVVDAGRGLLFASTAAAPFMVGYHQEDYGRSGVFAFDLKSGRLVRKALLPADDKRHILNAMVLDREGNVYVSDSGVPGIYRLRSGTEDLEVIVPLNVFRSTQGLALSDDEKTLYIADYTDGLRALDLASKTQRRVEAPPGAWLGGLDGLSRVADGFIAVQIGIEPNRVLKLRLDQQKQRITTVEILESNHPDYAGPIQGVVAGDAFLYVANSQLALGDETGAFAAERARATVILRLPL